jgi:hypothetical protein
MLNSHTHCQVAPADTQAKTWQRVCLSNRTTKTTDNPAKEIEHRSDNSSYTQVGVRYFYESEVLNQSSVLLMKFSAKNPHLRVAANRYQPY